MIQLFLTAALASELSLDHAVDLPRSIDPDEAALRYEVGTRSRAAGGGSLRWLGGRRWAAGLSGFIELEQTTPGWSPVPWAAYRAHVGFRAAGVVAEGRAGRWILDGGAFHESDHSAQPEVEAARHGVPADAFPNGTISTFEYLSLRLTREWTGRLTWHLRPSVRVMTPNFVRFDQSRRDGSVELELTVAGEFVGELRWYVGGYGEVVFHDYQASLPLDRRPGPYRMAMGQLGIALGDLDVFVSVRAGNGRGVAFTQVYGATPTVGLRAVL